MSSVATKYAPRSNTGTLEVVRDQRPSATTDTTGTDGPLSPSEVRKFKKLCQQIKSNVHLAAILQTVSDPDARKQAYDEFRPWIRGFAVSPYDELRFF